MQAFEDKIKSSKNILIISHVNPDGDTLGAMCGLFNAIKFNFKKQAQMLILGKVPKIYEEIPSVLEAKTIDNFDKSREFDLVITVDVAALERIIDAKVFFEKAKFSINIDHHGTNKAFGNLAIIEEHASSTCEVLFNIFEKLGWKTNLEIAKCLYYGILTDTGGFRFENASPKVFAITSQLVSQGVVPKDIYKKCYETKSKEMVLFQSYCVSKAEFTPDNKIAYTTIYKKDMEKFGAKDEHTDGIAETLRSIDTTEVSFVVKEVDTKICKISMRSKNINIAEVCEKFGGGGHKNASGCTIKSDVKNSIAQILDVLK